MLTDESAILLPVLHEDGHSYKLPEFLALVQEQYPDGFPSGTPLGFQSEPSWNLNTNLVLTRLAWQAEETGAKVFPYIETSLPQEANVRSFLSSLINAVNEEYAGKAVIKLLLGSTSEASRKKVYEHPWGLASIAKLFEHLPKLKEGRIVLSFDPFCPLDFSKLRRLFPPEFFAIELHPVDSVPLEQPLFQNQNLKQAIHQNGYALFEE